MCVYILRIRIYVKFANLILQDGNHAAAAGEAATEDACLQFEASSFQVDPSSLCRRLGNRCAWGQLALYLLTPST